MQNSSYLESRVLTAPPHRLHLMLVEGAIRFGRQAEVALKAGDQVTAATPLLRAMDIVGELLVGVRENKSEVNKKLSDFYLYLFRLVSEAKIKADPAVLAEVLQLLEYERQTWQMVCDKLGGDEGAAASAPRSPAFAFGNKQPATSGISFQA